MKNLGRVTLSLLFLMSTGYASASLQDSGPAMVIASAQQAPIDRFSDQAGHLFRRSANPSLPAPNAAIHFDTGPFITRGFGPNGDYVSYYNFDVISKTPAPIYVFFKMGEMQPVKDQLNLVNVIPGDMGYSDFWNVVKVIVPDNYVANSITSMEQLQASGYEMEKTEMIFNCPIVPEGSTAYLRYHGNTDTQLHKGWYRGMIVNYFTFSERELKPALDGSVPLSPIYVTFNKNPNSMDAQSGPASGFHLDPVTGRTHNVVQTIPEYNSYSPLWSVAVYDNRSFASVHNLTSVQSAGILARDVATVNCPIVLRTRP